MRTPAAAIACLVGLSRIAAAQPAFEWVPIPPWGPPAEAVAISGDGSVLFDWHRVGTDLTLWRWESTDWTPFITLPDSTSGVIIAVTDSGDGFVANVVRTDGSSAVCRYRSCCGLEWMTGGGQCSASAASRDLGAVIGSSNLGAFFWNDTEQYLPADVLLTTVSGNGLVAFGREASDCGECPCANTIRYSVDEGLTDLHRLTFNLNNCGAPGTWDAPVGASWSGDLYVVNRMDFVSVPNAAQIWTSDTGWRAAGDFSGVPASSVALAVSDAGTVYGIARSDDLRVFSLDRDLVLHTSEGIVAFVGGIMQDMQLLDLGTMSAVGRYASWCIRTGGAIVFLWYTPTWGLEDAVPTVHRWYTQNAWGACYANHRFCRDGSTLLAWFSSGTGPALARVRFNGRSADMACDADFDQSGFVDTDDFDAFVHAFEAGDPTADRDGTCFVDTDDFDAFVHAFEVGC